MQNAVQNSRKRIDNKMIVIDILAIIVSMILFIASLFRLKNEFNCRLFYYWFFWIIFVLPLILDYVIGYPTYSYYGSRMRGFLISYGDNRTRIYYAAFIVFIQLVILFHRPRIRIKLGNEERVNKSSKIQNYILSNRMTVICIAFAIIAPVICILLGWPQVIYEFGWREAKKYQEFVSRGFFTYIEEISYIGTVAAVILLMFDREKKGANKFLFKIFSAILLFFNLCIESKRSIFLFLLIIMSYIFLLKNKKKNLMKIIVTMLGLITIGLAASMYVKIVSRGYVGFDALYTTTRIDFFRDDTVKMALYSTFNKNQMKILSYPFESYVMQIGYLFFLGLISSAGFIDIKRMGYDYYLTSALTGTNLLNEKWMTTSMYDEAIANFGIAGIIVIAIFMSYYLRFIDEQSEFESILWLAFLVLYTMFSLDYIIIFGEAVIVVHILLKQPIVFKYKTQ